MIAINNRRFLISAFGVCLGLLGLLYALLWDSVFNYMLEKEMILRPDSKIYDLWTNPPMKLAIDFYFFNWTNSEEFNDMSTKPKLQEVGPYRFYETQEKFDIKWHSENASVTYSKRSKYHFDAAASNGSLSDKIITANALFLAASAQAKYWNPVRRAFADFALSMYHNDMSLRKTVGELLFDGFEDTLMNFASVLPVSISNVKLPFDRFGYCYPRNSSGFFGTYNVKTGADDIRNYGKLNTWNYKNSTNYFPQECSKVRGTTGEFQPPYLQKNRSIEIFVPDFCRPLKLDYVRTVMVDGIEGYEYAGGRRMMDNGTLDPENTCYCNGECVPSGLINISSCWFNVALFVSYPHFYQADPYYIDQFAEGLNPKKERHELYLVLEPRTSLLLELGGRFQANVLVEPSSYFKMLRSSRKIFFPLIWFDAKTRVSPELAGYIKAISQIIKCGEIFGWLCFTIGALLATWHPLSRRLRSQLPTNPISRGLQISQNHIHKMDFAPQPEGFPLLDKIVQSMSLESEETNSEMLNGSNSWNMNSSG